MSHETVTRAVVFTVVLVALLVAHSIGDHIAQTDHQAALKSEPGAAGWRALLGHLITYHLTLLGVLLLTAHVLDIPLSAPGVTAGLAFSALTHGLLDRRWPVRKVLRATRSPQFAETTTPVSGMYVADQALHQAALLVTALLIAAL